MLLLLLACNERPGISETCVDVATPTTLDDSALGFDGESVLASLATGRAASWTAVPDLVTFTFASTGEVQRVERSDGKDGGCASVGEFLRLPMGVAVTADDFSAQWSGAIDARDVADAALELNVSAVDGLDVSSSLEQEVEDFAGAEDAEVLGYAAWLSGAVSGGDLRLEAEVSWSNGDTGDNEDDTYTLLEGDWVSEPG